MTKLNSIESTNLDLALEKFIIAIRLFISTELKAKYGAKWERIYAKSLQIDQQKSWDNSLLEGADPIELIDYGNLKSFSLNQKEFFIKFFGKDHQSLPTMLTQIKDARNDKAHYKSLDIDTAEMAYLQMIMIAKKLNMNELAGDLRKLKDGSQNAIEIAPVKQNPIKIIPNEENKSRKGIDKKDAIDLINRNIGSRQLSNINTFYSNINKAAPVWWFNIPPEKFNHPLNILLISRDEIIWILLPKGSCSPPEKFFNSRKDNAKIDLRISIEGRDYLKDTLCMKNFDFKPFVKNKFSLK